MRPLLLFVTAIVSLIVVSTASACGASDADPTVVVRSAQRAVTSESGGTAEIAVVLTAEPSASVSFSVASSDEAEGTVSTNALTFTPQNWFVEQIVTVTGIDDGVGDDTDGGADDYEVTFGEAVSDDTRFVGLAPAAVALRNLDNEVKFEIFRGMDENDNLGWSMFEHLAPLELSVRLTDEPYETVRLGVNLYLAGTAKIPVTPANGNIPLDPNVSFEPDRPIYYTEIEISPETFDTLRPITVYPVYDEGQEDPGKVFDLAIAASGDRAYENHLRQLIIDETIPYQIVNIDPDAADVIVTPRPIRLCVDIPDQITVQLSQDPDQPVNLEFTSSDADNLVIEPTTLMIDDGNPVTVTLTALAAGARNHTLSMVITSSDPVFSVLDNETRDFSVTVLDDTVQQPGGRAEQPKGEQQFCN